MRIIRVRGGDTYASGTVDKISAPVIAWFLDMRFQHTTFEIYLLLHSNPAKSSNKILAMGK